MEREFNQKANCRTELLKHINELNAEFNAQVKCIDIYTDFSLHRWSFDGEEMQKSKEKEFEDKKFSLREGHSLSESLDFFKDLNFNYDCGYGTQELYGIIWFKDGSYSEREEYDGSEGWAHRRAPKLPEQCIPKPAQVNLD